MHALLHSVPLTLQQAIANPCLCQILPDTHRQVRVSLCRFTGPFSWVLVHTRFFCESSKSLFPQSCVSSGSSVVELMATSSKRVYATPRSAALRAPAPVAGHCWAVPLQETLKYSQAVHPSVYPYLFYSIAYPGRLQGVWWKYLLASLSEGECWH